MTDPPREAGPSSPAARPARRYARVEAPQLSPRERVAAHWRHLLLLAAVGGLLLALAPPFTALVGAAVAAAVAGWARAGTAVVLACALTVLVGAAGGDARLAALDRSALGPLLGHEVSEVVEVTEAPRAWGTSARLRGEPVLLRLDGVWACSGPCDQDSPTPGALLRVRGVLRAPSPFARARGAHADLRAEQAVVVGRRGGWRRAVDDVRGRAQRALERRLPAEEGALLRGMVLGDDSALPDDRRDELRAAGLGHLVAASGQNVALLAALAIGACAVLGVPFRTRMAVVLGLVAFYVPLAGAGPSIQRAGVMGAAVLAATIAGQGASRWYGLGLAALATLALDPRAAADPGWQLSFAAVLGLLVFVRPARDALRARGVGPGLAEAIAVTAVATLVTAPVAAVHFGEVSLASLPANVLAAPAVAPITWLGMLGTFAGQLDPLLGTPFAWLAAPLLAFVLLVGETAAALPHATVGPAVGAAVALTAAAALLPRSAPTGGAAPRGEAPGGRAVPLAEAVGRGGVPRGEAASGGAAPRGEAPGGGAVPFAEAVGRGGVLRGEVAGEGGVPFAETVGRGGVPRGEAPGGRAAPLAEAVGRGGVPRGEAASGGGVPRGEAPGDGAVPRGEVGGGGGVPRGEAGGGGGVPRGEAGGGGAAPLGEAAGGRAAPLASASAEPARRERIVRRWWRRWAELAVVGTTLGLVAFAGATAWPVGVALALRRRLAAAAVVLAAAGVAHAQAPKPPPAPERLRVTFLDVGQGDATLVQDREHAVLIDAGVPGSGVEDRLHEAGVEHLDLLVVTHADADHAGGVADVLQDVDADLVLDGRDGVASSADAALAAERTVPARAGQVLRVGDLTLRVLSPSAQTPGETNDRAVVLLVEAHGERVLLPADAETPTLQALPLPRIDVLKVSHHGSDDPGLPQLLRRIRPQLAGIEVGEDNTYGHPTASTVTALRSVPIVTRTDRDGTTRADLEAGRWVVRRSPYPAR